MWLRFLVAFSLGMPLAASAVLPARSQAEQAFPYTAHINSDNVYVRSGPGDNYYPTGKLNQGDPVEVYRHDPGGWYAIRPPEGSFSWVSGRFLEVGHDGVGKVIGDRVAARVGSQFSDIRDVIQVRLHRGELVEVLGQKHSATDPGSGPWYKIAPPSGEFRWVSGKFVDANYAQSGVRNAPAEYSPMMAAARPANAPVAVAQEASYQQAEDARVAGRPAVGDVRRAGHTADRAEAAQQTEVRAADHWSGSREADSAVRGSFDPAPEAAVRHTNKFVEPAQDPEGVPTTRRLSPEEFRAELEEIDMELSIMLAEEPTVWKLDELALRTQALLAEAETAVERGRVRLVANKIALSQDIKRRYDTVSGLRVATERRNRQLAALAQNREEAGPQLVATGRFDGVGRLVRVKPAKLGAPPYALVNEKNQIACYITPAPGVNLNYYVGQWVGVNGSRGYIPESRAQHVTAKHVTPVEVQRLR